MDTSWQNVSKWYDDEVGDKGHYYHQNVILPGIQKLWNVSSDSRVLDLGCGQGILSRSIPKVQRYLGLDLAPDLIESARHQAPESNYEFRVQDIGVPFDVTERFTHVSIILALQNVKNFKQVIANAANHLESNGQFLIVLNHPYFRIPKQSDWGIDESSNQQYRKVYRYMSSLEVPITMNPGDQTKPKLTWSYHHSLRDYSEQLAQSGFVISRIEEWVSDKVSEGKAAQMENKARAEIPLFMAILATKM